MFDNEIENLTYDEIKERIAELSNQRDKLEIQMRDDKKKLFLSAVDKWKPLVGCCFKSKNELYDYMFVVTDVPQEEYTMTETIYNRYKLPVFVVDRKGKTRDSFITSYAVDADDVYAKFTKKFEPISHEDFLIEVGDIISSEIIEKAVNKYNK